VPAFDVPVIDTTGAGDAFHAGYAFARAKGEDLGSCLEWGSAVAGLKCRDWGGRRGLPDRSEVVQLLAAGIRRPLDGLQGYLQGPGI
jgi:sugar/nucleoside kinase (ribokinase family)